MRIKIFILGFLFAILCSYSLSYADVPQMINYQGKLTDTLGALIDTVVSMEFAIYSDTSGMIAPLWNETHDSVRVEYGIFSVLLGSVDTIPFSVFNGDVRYLGISVGGDSEMRPLKPIVSVGYAFRAAHSQVADSVANGGGIECADCDDRFVNVQGPDSVYSSSGIAFKGRATGSSSSNMYGLYGSSNNSSTGYAYGVYGTATNSSSGNARGGYFSTSSSGTGYHYGVDVRSYGSSSSSTYGTYSYADNFSTGNVYAGYFNATTSGTGYHYGVFASGNGSSSSPTYGVGGFAYNSSSGTVYGGYFETSSSGTGTHYGVYATGYGSSSSNTYGTYCYADNSSSGTTYGGNFYVSSSGTGNHYGINAAGYGSSVSSALGVRGYASNSSTGAAYGGYFYTSSSGTGRKYGVFAEAPTDEGYAGYFSGDVRITDSLVVLGGKSAAVKVDNGEYRLLYSQESPEVWFEDFGEGQLVNGRAHIELDPLFLETVTINSQHTMKVFITLNDDCNGIYVKRGNTGFDVVELQNGLSNASFTYRVVAKRRGFENIRLAKMGGPTPEEVEAEQVKLRAEMEQEELESQRDRERMEAERVEMEEERQLMEEQSQKTGGIENE